MIENTLRWDSYILFSGSDKIISFWKDHSQLKNRKLLYILGKGFDLRMNLGITTILGANCSTNLDCILVEFDEGIGSASNNYKKNVDKNYSELQGHTNINIIIKKIELWKGEGRHKRRIGDRESANLISSFKEIEEYTDIIIDISALPRGIYFSLIGKVMTLIDYNTEKKNCTQNLFILVAENALIDQKTIERDIDDDLKYTHGFTGGLELTADYPIIWFPILGENRRKQIEMANLKINPREICPILPFPSKDIRRSDALIIEYHQLLFDELRIEPQNILYVPEQNPFEVYRSLTTAIMNYNKTLDIINGCRAAISTFSSKLLSIGALLTAYEFIGNKDDNKGGVGILNVDSKGYDIETDENIKLNNGDTELFFIWLTGEPYNA